MPSSYTIGEQFEAFIKDKLSSGRYSSAREVLREGPRLLERQDRLAALDAAIADGAAALDAGRVVDAADAFDRLEVRYTRMARDRGEM